MKSEGSRFLDGEEEGGVTGNLSSLQTLRREVKSYKSYKTTNGLFCFKHSEY